MKTYTWEIKLSVSEENSGLVPMLVNENDVKGATETYDEAVLRVVADRFHTLLKDVMILPKLQEHFGKSGRVTVEAIRNSLENGALTVVKTIEE